jgi:uncharacterized protein YjbI with pentapeptide repeats
MNVTLSYLAGAGWQFFDNNGIPLSGGKLYSYAAGTTTPQTTYTSMAGNIAHTNPIILDSAGRVAEEIWLTIGQSFKFTLATSTNVEIWTKDNITGIANFPVIFTSQYATFAEALSAAAGKTLVVDSQVVLTANTVLPTTIAIDVAYPGGFTIPNGTTLTINSVFSAGLYRVFTCVGTGVVKFGYGSIVSVFPSWWGFTANAATTVGTVSSALNKAAINYAYKSLPDTVGNYGTGSSGGTVQFPSGTFYVDPDIEVTRASIIFQGAGGGYGYVIADLAGTRLLFTSGPSGSLANASAFDMSTTPGDGINNSDFCGLQSLYISGQNVLDYGAIIGGCKILDQVTISDTNFAGVKFTNYINSTVVTRCSFSDNNSHGAIFEHSLNGNTKFSVSDTNFMRNGQTGSIVYNAVGAEFNNCTFEGNQTHGLIINKPTGGDLYNLTFNSCWFEGNQQATSGAGYQIQITAQVPGLGAAPPGPIYFNSCNVNGPPSITAAYGIDLVCGTVTYTGGSILMTLGQEVNLGTFALACQFIDVVNTLNYLTSTAGTGTLCSVTYPKITGGTNRAGEITSGGFWTKGGRTQILWFTFTGSISAGGSAIADAVNGTAGVLKTFPLTGQVGSLVGMIIAKKVPVTAGSLTVIPYYTAGWSGATTNYTTAYPLTVGTDNISYTFPFETFTFSSGATTNNTSFLGISFTGSATYNQGTDSDCMVGLIVEI